MSDSKKSVITQAQLDKVWNDINRELRHKLVDYDFRDVTGIVEKIKGREHIIEITSARALFYGNQGMLAVVDYSGHTWIRRWSGGREFLNGIEKDIFADLDYASATIDSEFPFHVPFSNDGGEFLNRLWPKTA